MERSTTSHWLVIDVLESWFNEKRVNESYGTSRWRAQPLGSSQGCICLGRHLEGCSLPPNGKKCIDCRTTASWTNLTKHLKKGWSLSATETVSLAGSSQSRLTFQGLWRQVSITHVGGWSKFIAVVSILGNDFQKRRLPRGCGRT